MVCDNDVCLYLQFCLSADFQLAYWEYSWKSFYSFSNSSPTHLFKRTVNFKCWQLPTIAWLQKLE